MKFISTRGSETAGALQAILKGQAEDGGLFAPAEFPRYFPGNLSDMNYRDLACEVLSPYLCGGSPGDYTKEEIRRCCEGAYSYGASGNFDDERIAPVKKVGDGAYFLELFHGRTFAFKDMALSVLPLLMAAAKSKLGVNEETVILTATSGDTGGAALAGFAGIEGFRAIAFYPLGGVSDVQRRQMTARDEPNVTAFAVKGNFDDAQRGVKKIFADLSFKERLAAKGFRLSSANSINIGRLLPQIAYYYYAYGQMENYGAIKHGEPLNFAVPTGNFGNILAGWYAKKMGLPIDVLLCASNENTVLYDFFNTGVYDANRKFILTGSPSMDILISSNLERLLYHLSNGDAPLIKKLMGELSESGQYRFDPKGGGITGEFADEGEALGAIAKLSESGYIIDPHTAVARAALMKYSGKTEAPFVTIATASPYKFPDTLARAGAALKESEAPQALKDLYDKKERNSEPVGAEGMAEYAANFLEA